MTRRGRAASAGDKVLPDGAIAITAAANETTPIDRSAACCACTDDGRDAVVTASSHAAPPSPNSGRFVRPPGRFLQSDPETPGRQIKAYHYESVGREERLVKYREQQRHRTCRYHFGAVDVEFWQVGWRAPSISSAAMISMGGAVPYRGPPPSPWDSRMGRVHRTNKRARRAQETYRCVGQSQINRPLTSSETLMRIP